MEYSSIGGGGFGELYMVGQSRIPVLATALQYRYRYITNLCAISANIGPKQSGKCSRFFNVAHNGFTSTYLSSRHWYAVNRQHPDVAHAIPAQAMLHYQAIKSFEHFLVALFQSLHFRQARALFAILARCLFCIFLPLKKLTAVCYGLE